MIRRLVQYAFWAWCILLSGCTVWQNARRTLIHEPAAYSWKHDRRRSVDAYRQLADQVWQQEAIHCPDLLTQPDYVMGFRDGFVDYVYAGGTGEPPPVPPRHFWNVVLRGPDGKQRVEQWFAGYRHGARVARDGGYRELGRLNSSLFGIGGPPNAGYMPDAMGPLHLEPDAFWPQEDFDARMEMLPEPGDAPTLSPPKQPPAVPSDHGEQSSTSIGETALELPNEIEAKSANQADPMGDDSQQDRPAPAEPPNVDMPATDPEDNNRSSAAPKRAAPTGPPTVATEPAELPVIQAVKISPAPAAAPSPARRPSAEAGASTLRFVAQLQNGGIDGEPAANQPSALVQTSFIVKAPPTAAPPSREDIAHMRSQPPRRPNVEPSSPAKSTIRIREGTPDENSEPRPTPARSVRTPRKPSFVR